MSSEISIEIDKGCFAPGEVITGQISWNCSKPPSQIILKLRWNTDGRGTADIATAIEKNIPCSGLKGETGFELEIPEECPPSYNGKLISLEWNLHAQADISWTIDPKTSIPLIISDTGKPYRPPAGFKAKK